MACRHLNQADENSPHWRYGFLSLPKELREAMADVYDEMWLSLSADATFDLLVLQGPPWSTGQGKTAVWASFPQHIPFSSASEATLFSRHGSFAKSLYKVKKIQQQTSTRSCNDDDSVEVVRMYNYSQLLSCLLYTSPSPRDLSTSRMPSSA